MLTIQCTRVRRGRENTRVPKGTCTQATLMLSASPYLPPPAPLQRSSQNTLCMTARDLYTQRAST